MLARSGLASSTAFRETPEAAGTTAGGAKPEAAISAPHSMQTGGTLRVPQAPQAVIESSANFPTPQVIRGSMQPGGTSVPPPTASSRA